MSFEFQLVLTERCNLNCNYCYINQRANEMSKDVFDKHFIMLDKLLKQYNQHEYNAALFGGEPFLNWELIEYIIPILKNDPRCKFIITMTNGLLLNDEYKRNYIDENNIALSISFDGLWNKTNRQLHNGDSSLDEYLKEPLKSYITKDGGSCKVMINPSSVSTMTENFMWFVETYGISNPDFTLVRDDIWSDEDVSIYKQECHRLANKVIEYYNKGINANVGIFQLYLLDLVFGEAYGKRSFCCYAGCSGAGFMPDGNVYPCARFGSNKKYHL